MNRKIYLIICFLITLNSYGQKNTIKVKKIKTDTVNIVGQWIRIFDKTLEGKIIKPKAEEIDTLNYSPNNKFLKQQAGSKEFSSWSFTQKERTIIYENIQFTMTYEGQTINTSFDFYYDHIGMLTKDTLTLLMLNETMPPTLYQTNYYYRKK